MRGWLSGLAGLGLLTLPATVRAADPSVGVDFYTAYVWRGITIQDTPVLQPWVDISGISFGKDVSLGVNVWGNFPLSDWKKDGQLRADGGEFSEFDATLTLSLPKGFKAGYTEFTFPTTAAIQYLGFREVFTGWTGSFGVDVSANVYYGVHEITSIYGSVSVGRAFALSPKLKLTVEGQAGACGKEFAQIYGGADRKAGFSNYGFMAKLAFTPTEKITLGVNLGHVGSLDKSVLPAQPIKFLGGVTALVAF